MKKRLRDFVDMMQGVNSTRIKNKEAVVLYDQTDFEHDLLEAAMPNENLGKSEKGDFLIKEGDIIINSMKQQATIASSQSVGKTLTMNFLKVDFLNEELDKRFFVYLFNENRQMKRLKEREAQGTTSSVQKIPINSLKSLEVPAIPLERQKQIGRTYADLLAFRKKQLEVLEQNNKFTLEILERATKMI